MEEVCQVRGGEKEWWWFSMVQMHPSCDGIHSGPFLRGEAPKQSRCFDCSGGGWLRLCGMTLGNGVRGPNDDAL